ncbi:variably expressed lipoprotein and hemagglutinin (VlhA) family protein [Mycoplasmoides gallisepticum str. F]|nr:hypothetical protein [Mycoplasmoides gallisepticum]ADC31336.1 variably expressed lipoprotein and hemagglutinin (VlhA) family protein [Mycoplasmoides gallisepticum str. F]
MKRKNILKFVSLLGIGSFVMLAAASCTTPVNPTWRKQHSYLFSWIYWWSWSTNS